MSHVGMASKRTFYVVAGIIISGVFCSRGVAADGPLSSDPRVAIAPRPRAPREPAATRPNIRLDVDMVLIPVTVTDSKDHPVTGLSAEAFQLSEDNVEQKIVSFFSEDGPVSVGFVVDTSSSMQNRMDKSVAAIRQLLERAIPGDEFFLIQFSDSPTLLTRFTADTEEILKPLSSMRPRGWTALLDAVYLGAHQMRSARNPRKALFILSDGADNNSRYSESETRNLLMESDVRVFAVGLFARPRFLEKMAMETGGNAYWVHKLTELPDVIEKLSRELRSQYVLGYSPNHLEYDGKYRKVRVDLQPLKLIAPLLAPLRIAWRRGYYAPGD
jgi:Ca-activated chloride channel family protein